MPAVNIKAGNRSIRKYHAELDELRGLGIVHEGGLRLAFGDLLRGTAGKGFKWINELPVPGSRVRPDATLIDEYHLPYGHWEAKDGSDDLEVEIRNKRERDYPFENIIFEDTRQAILYQDGRRVMQVDCSKPADLARLLTTFYQHHMPDFVDFHEAVGRFSDEVPQLAQGLQDRIAIARSRNTAYQRAFADFMTLCREALNPNISREAVEEMLIQHLLTERLIRRVFDQENFVRRNVIAAEVEKVIDALTGQHFNRREFLGSLDRFYAAIEKAADRLADFSDKQRFINTIYERFFQGFSVKVADTHGIVYTPQEVVEFMVAATDELLQREFGKKLGDEGVCVIDPCTGTGNFVVQLLRRVARENPGQLDSFYRERLFANEVMLMPYYIASLNIEHEYHTRSGRYEAFEGLCFVDTLDLAEGDMPEMFQEFSQKNSARVERQKAAKINVVIGNPPYNVGQLDENDNNKNRKYEVVDRRIRETYAKGSRATLNSKLYDAYVKFFRWASDRLQGPNGVVCLITNNSLVDGVAFDGMRRELLRDFSSVHHLDLAGNFRKGKGEGENVFGNVTSVGVGITLALRSAAHGEQRELRYWRVPADASMAVKLKSLAARVKDLRGALGSVAWRDLTPDERHTWLRPPHAEEFERFVTMSIKDTRAVMEPDAGKVFGTYSLGVSTNRDAVVYGYDQQQLLDRIEEFIEAYNIEVDRYFRLMPDDIDNFVRYERVKWSRNLKRELKRRKYVTYDAGRIRKSLYRPFAKRHLYFDNTLIDEMSQIPRIFPSSESEQENLALSVSGVSSSKPFQSLMLSLLPNLDLLEKTQCFPFYTYDANGTRQSENITAWAHRLFTAKYPPHFSRSTEANLAICLTAVGNSGPFHTLMAAQTADLHLTGDSQCFPLYTYDADGTNRRENVTDWALASFRKHYGKVHGEGGQIAQSKRKTSFSTSMACCITRFTANATPIASSGSCRASRWRPSSGPMPRPAAPSPCCTSATRASRPGRWSGRSTRSDRSTTASRRCGP